MLVILTETNFEHEVQGSPDPVLAEFFADWSGSCRILDPMLDTVRAEFSGRVRFGRVNVDDNRQTVDRYRVHTVPTLLLFSRGRVVDRIQGVVPGHTIAETLRVLLNERR